MPAFTGASIKATEANEGSVIVKMEDGQTRKTTAVGISQLLGKKYNAKTATFPATAEPRTVFPTIDSRLKS
jgi:hypothetical protein